MKSFHVVFNKHHDLKTAELLAGVGVEVVYRRVSSCSTLRVLALHFLPNWSCMTELIQDDSRMSNKPRMLLSFPSASFSYESFWHVLCQYLNARLFTGQRSKHVQSL